MVVSCIPLSAFCFIYLCLPCFYLPWQGQRGFRAHKSGARAVATGVCSVLSSNTTFIPITVSAPDKAKMMPNDGANTSIHSFLKDPFGFIIIFDRGRCSRLDPLRTFRQCYSGDGAECRMRVSPETARRPFVLYGGKVVSHLGSRLATNLSTRWCRIEYEYVIRGALRFVESFKWTRTSLCVQLDIASAGRYILHLGRA